MGIGVTELMGVEACANTREAAPSSDHLLDARPSEASFARQPELWSPRMTVRRAQDLLKREHFKAQQRLQEAALELERVRAELEQHQNKIHSWL